MTTYQFFCFSLYAGGWLRKEKKVDLINWSEVYICVNWSWNVIPRLKQEHKRKEYTESMQFYEMSCSSFFFERKYKIHFETLLLMRYKYISSWLQT